MTMYGMLHGENEYADVILAALGLSRDDVGRYRDCWITGDGKIAVYTRNGGGNRGCWHEENPRRGNEKCHGERYEVEVDETVEVTAEEAALQGYTLLNVFIGSKRLAKTGRRVLEARWTCAEPDSAQCSCPGCTITHRLPKHPLYLYDRDDDFDCTYATLYFQPPDSIPDDFPRGISGDERWANTLAALSAAADKARAK